MNKDIEKELLECSITFKDNQDSKEYEYIKNNYFLIEDNIQELIKSTNDLSVDTDILKEYNYDPFYHTKSECKMNDGLNELNNSLTSLFNRLNTISQNIKNLKEKRKAAQKQFEAQAKEEEKAIKQLKTGTPTGAAASVKNTINSALEKTQKMYAKNTEFEGKAASFLINWLN